MAQGAPKDFTPLVPLGGGWSLIWTRPLASVHW